MLCYCGRCRMYIKAQLEAEKDRANRLEQEERDKLLAFRLASGSNSNHTTVVVAASTKEEKVRQEWQAGGCWAGYSVRRTDEYASPRT